ncbi:dipeptidase [Ferruginibacter paludis]|uniref:dipeptidase n=1 Tax=Ferruginibacter paludis TaxID=1310417 RepID=UPI0025B495C1|nr:dipeptidase [Ferruginibacter paludis]MDN3657042.1 dipeptidase [Ferruginibacter paludis]
MKHLFFLLLSPLCFLTTKSQSYKKLHYDAILIDTHNDIPSSTIEKKVQFDTNLKGKTHSDLNRMKEGGIDVQIFSIFCGPEQEHPYAFANREIDSVYAWCNRNPGKMMLVKTPAQLQQAVKAKKLAAMLGVEGGHMIENDLNKLDTFFNRGVRYMTLTWNNSTDWATSAADETLKGDSLKHKGLTDFGKQIVNRMNDLGMMVDISHNGEQTFWDVINTTTKPIIASHSSVWNLCKHRRNLKDEQIKAIGKNGGVIHLNFYAGFIDSTYEAKAMAFVAQHKSSVDSLIALKIQPDYAAIMVGEIYKDEVRNFRPHLSVLIDHLDYIVKLIGVDHVGLGSDFDGIEAPPLELNGVEDYPLVTKALLERGYSEKDIRKILGGNFIRVFKANAVK